LKLWRNARKTEGFSACQKLCFCASAKPLSQEYAEKEKQFLQQAE